MTDFWSQTKIKATRKPHTCEWCRKVIPSGSGALRTVGVWDGGFYARTTHQDCEEAVNAYHDICGYTWEDDLTDLYEIARDRNNWPWLLETYPVVAGRVGLKEMMAEEIGHE